jgi:hypothetical protein
VSSYALFTLESAPTTGEPSVGNSYTLAHAAGAASTVDSSADRSNVGQDRYFMYFVRNYPFGADVALSAL